MHGRGEAARKAEPPQHKGRVARTALGEEARRSRHARGGHNLDPPGAGAHDAEAQQLGAQPVVVAGGARATGRRRDP
jgi:hypothetical protein